MGGQGLVCWLRVVVCEGMKRCGLLRVCVCVCSGREGEREEVVMSLISPACQPASLPACLCISDKIMFLCVFHYLTSCYLTGHNVMVTP